MKIAGRVEEEVLEKSVDSRTPGGRNSGWRMRPPASAVQTLREMESRFPIRTAHPMIAACLGNLIRASSATSARIPAA
jgi:hypothetical protein